ncbi:MAG TPA: acyltransferase, partial [Sphingomicrobium sp.]|nr:acyltransferase [Sphingomicrobium sp.]
MTSARDSTLSYRPDIDGLRAVAVLAVIWFHSDLPGMPGGFTGVDIFFVISGYLITSLIHRQLRAGRFSFRHFYERRFRRIAPALLTVCVAIAPLAFVLLLPFELKQFAQSAIATVAMGSNFYFWRAGDYFSLTAAIVPLLHTWSLGVEEQFYLLFPATLVVAERLKISRASIGALAAGSFLVSAIASYETPVASFYLLPARGWELMIGASLAVETFSIAHPLKPAAGVLGIALIVT